MRLLFAASCLLPLTFAYASAEEAMPIDMHHDHHEHAAPTSPKKEPAPEPKRANRSAQKKATPHSDHIHGRTNASAAKHQGHKEGTHQGHTGGMQQGHMEGMHQGHEMKGFFGPYPMNREASGTSWQ